MPQTSFFRPARAVTAFALTGLLTLTACEADLPQQGDGDGAGSSDGEGFDELAAPDPRGSQLSHDDMREVLDEHYSGAGVTDTDDYYASLRDIETELQKLAVDPTDCKQYVVQSASPVPEGALIAHADTNGADEDSEEGTEGENTGEEDAEDDTDPEASASAGGFSRTTVTLPFGQEDDGDDEAGSGEGGDAGADDDGEDAEDGSDEEEAVEVDLPSERQATVYTFQDWRAADAYFSGEESGLDNCGSYTVTRGGIGEDDDPELETSTSVDTVEVTSDADSALGIYRETETEGSTDQSVAVMLRDSSNIVVLTAPAGGELDEEEAEIAVEELEDEAFAVLSDL